MDKSINRSVAWMHMFAAATRPVTDRLTYTTQSGIAAGLKRCGGYGFVPRKITDEEKFYLSLDLTGKVVYDIGSYEGIFSLFAARAVGPTGCLVVFEPNPESFRRTERNLELNHFGCSITLRNFALGAERYTATMACPSGEPARATLDKNIAAKYSSNGETSAEFQVQVEKLDDSVAMGLPIPRFIKIDTEGYEYDVIRGAERTLREHGPDLFIEMHGTTPDHWIENRRNVQRMITNCGYSVYDMYRKLLSEADPASHLYCRKS